MGLRAALLFALALVALPAAGQGQAFTNRATELKARGAADAPTLASLPENTEVKVLARGGGWTRVEAGGKAGWVRVFHLRFPVTATSEGSSGGGFLSGLTSALGGNRRSPSATIATTGIRGLSPEELKNASPDAAAVQRMQSYRIGDSAAERFAREGKLAAVKVDYKEGSSR